MNAAADEDTGIAFKGATLASVDAGGRCTPTRAIGLALACDGAPVAVAIVVAQKGQQCPPFKLVCAQGY